MEPEKSYENPQSACCFKSLDEDYRLLERDVVLTGNYSQTFQSSSSGQSWSTPKTDSVKITHNILTN